MEVTRAAAVLDGVALVSRHWRVAAVRRGDVIVVSSAPARFPGIRAIPVLRGLFAYFIESPTELNWSATEPTPPEQLPPNGFRSPVSLFMMLAWAHGLPQLALHFVARSLTRDSWGFQATVLAIQVLVVLLYLHYMPRVRGADRLFRYAGAFKKLLWQLDAPRTSPTDHPRWHWRSSNITIVLALAIVAALGGVVLPHLAVGGWGTLLVRIGLTPLAFGIADEIQRVLARLGHGPVMRVLFAPLVLVDRFGTHEPDEAMLEVASACAAKLRALEEERR